MSADNSKSGLPFEVHLRSSFRMTGIQGVSLKLAVAAPLLYFGLQVLASPFYPGYDLLSQPASALGSPGSKAPLVFNLGAAVVGLLIAGGSLGVFAALRALHAAPTLAFLASGTVLLIGLSSIWAGVFPLPSPMHARNPLAIGFFLAPLVVAVALWAHAPWPLRTYLLLNLLGFGVMAAVMSGTIPLDLGRYGGLMQRLLALTALGPVGAGAAFLASRLQAR